MKLTSDTQTVVEWDGDGDVAVLTVVLPNGFTLNLWRNGRYQLWDVNKLDALNGVGIVSEGSTIAGALIITKKALDQRADEMNKLDS